MKNLRSSTRGMVLAPIIISLFFLVKAFCPNSAANACFADQFAVPIFLPLVIVYRIFGDSSIIGGQEFIFVMAYWAFVGFLLGLLVDLWGRRNEVPQIDLNQTYHAMPIPAAKEEPPAPKPPINLLDQEDYKS